ncbi:MAG: ABC transporter ATP-binding protein [Sulfolobales archaeon]
MYDVRLENVHKLFGSRIVLDNISLRIPRGTIFCIVGPNGAGKTTMLRIISTLMRPSRGEVYIRDLRVDYSNISSLIEIRKMISYLPEEADTYSRLTGLEYLRFFAEIHNVKEEEVEFGVRLSGLSREVLNKKTGTYSKGMRRRLMLARTLMIKPQIAILDEPTSGLDVFSAVGLREVIKHFSSTLGRTIILSTHNMLEAEDLCHHIALLNEGRIIFSGTPVEIITKTSSENLEEAFVKLVKVSSSAKTS